MKKIIAILISIFICSNALCQANDSVSYQALLLEKVKSLKYYESSQNWGYVYDTSNAVYYLKILDEKKPTQQEVNSGKKVLHSICRPFLLVMKIENNSIKKVKSVGWSYKNFEYYFHLQYEPLKNSLK
jgi:hypothetical protein